MVVRVSFYHGPSAVMIKGVPAFCRNAFVLTSPIINIKLNLSNGFYQFFRFWQFDDFHGKTQPEIGIFPNRFFSSFTFPDMC